MNARNQVIPPAPLFYRHLQMDLSAALRSAAQDYEIQLRLSPDGREELTWWDTQMVRWNGRSVLIKPDLSTLSLSAVSQWLCTQISEKARNSAHSCDCCGYAGPPAKVLYTGSYMPLLCSSRLVTSIYIYHPSYWMYILTAYTDLFHMQHI